MARGKRRRDSTEVSCMIKYLVFGFNIVFWLLGGAICAIGLWAWSEKEMFQKIGQLTSIPLDPALIFIIVGAVIFIIGFTGCVGALRENTFLLLIFSVFVGVVFFIQLGFAVFLFMQRQWVKEQITEQLKIMIVQYREDPDLQNLIDWVQRDWLQCCGIEDYNDWDANVYFNCSSPSREKCGVPFSCCIVKEGDIVNLVNRQCGYDTRDRSLGNLADERIYTVGCLEAGEHWLNDNLIPVAGVAVGVALLQILGICFAQNLRSDIFAQMSRWH